MRRRLLLPLLRVCLFVVATLLSRSALAQDAPLETAPPAPVVPPSYGGPSQSQPPVPMPMADSVRVALVDAWLREMSGQEKFGRIFGGVSLTVLGPVAAALGGWLILDPQFHTTDSPLFTGVGVVGVGVGIFGLATGIFALSTELMAEDRFARFRESVESGLDVHELGRYEGELRAYADAARMARPLSIFGGIGFAVGGAVAIGLTAGASDHLDEEAELWGYAFGAGFIAGGALGALLALIETPYEKAWRMYEEGLLPDGSAATTARIDVTPFVSGEGAGVAAAGTF